ncbi:hypothetical protein [Nakamurella aerolata]|uniref:hypothetical protein n=1 Tax=Nakamurella aerolata TaxID=1656892 RepID=UPI001BB24524|nr:hypothetical protein [Nakamurella aerolata]
MAEWSLTGQLDLKRAVFRRVHAEKRSDPEFEGKVMTQMNLAIGTDEALGGFRFTFLASTESAEFDVELELRYVLRGEDGEQPFPSDPSVLRQIAEEVGVHDAWPFIRAKVASLSADLQLRPPLLLPRFEFIEDEEAADQGEEAGPPSNE